MRRERFNLFAKREPRSNRGWLTKVCIGVLLLLTVLSVSPTYSWMFEVREVVPPEGVNTLGEFLSWLPRPPHLFRVDIDGETFIECYGEKASTLASGPSQYVFDVSGKLIAWTPDCADVPLKPALPELESERSVRQKISVEDALRLIGHSGD